MNRTTCPRRIEAFGVWEFKEGMDSYESGSCSYCGSMEPNDFMQAVRDGCLLEPTDKNYKVYVEVPDRKFTKFYFQHLSEDQKREFVDLYNRGHVRMWGMDHDGNTHDRGRFYVFPFFMRRVI